MTTHPDLAMQEIDLIIKNTYRTLMTRVMKAVTCIARMRRRLSISGLTLHRRVKLTARLKFMQVDLMALLRWMWETAAAELWGALALFIILKLPTGAKRLKTADWSRLDFVLKIRSIYGDAFTYRLSENLRKPK